MGKIKISAFEYAIMQVADPEGSKNYEPETEEEARNRRIQDLKNKASKLRVLTPKSANKNKEIK